jgi:hypothetical protein
VKNPSESVRLQPKCGISLVNLHLRKANRPNSFGRQSYARAEEYGHGPSLDWTTMAVENIAYRLSSGRCLFENYPCPVHISKLKMSSGALVLGSTPRYGQLMLACQSREVARAGSSGRCGSSACAISVSVKVDRCLPKSVLAVGDYQPRGA